MIKENIFFLRLKDKSFIENEIDLRNYTSLYFI